MRSISLLLLFLAVIWLNSNVVAATYTVTNAADAGAGSLRQALADAKTQGGSNTIVFAPALAGQMITLASQLVVNDSFGPTIQVTIDATSLPGGLTISGNQAHQIFGQYHLETSLTLRDLSLVNGNTTLDGAAIQSVGALTLEQCRFNANSARYGGAIQHGQGTLTMTQCRFVGNQASESGGAMAVFGSTTATFTECTFGANSVTGPGGYGGAIYDKSGNVFTLTKCSFTSNSAGMNAGAMNISGSIATMTDCTFSENIAAIDGGAIRSSGGTVSLARCTFGFNRVINGSGGAVRNASNGQTVTLTQCTFTGNVAGGTSGYGGAICNVSYSSVAITQCTISGNTAGSGGGGGIWNHFYGSVTVTNSIIAGNTASSAADIQNYGSAFGRGGANLVGNPDGATEIFPSGMPNANGDYVGTTEAPLNPQLGPLAPNGGPTQTMALLAGSLARDRSIALYPPLTGDQRGRPILYKPDIGALESQFGVVSRPLLIPSDAPSRSVLCTLETDGTVTATSSNQAVIPNENITITGTGLSRTITITPIDGQVGNSTVVLTHQPSGETDTFQVYALSPDYVPVSIGLISDRTINEDASTLSVPFTVTDPAGAGLTVTVESINPTLVPIPKISLSGDGPGRTLAITPLPNENGSTQITVTTTDGLTTASRSFVLTVTPVNDAPSFIKGANQFTETSAAGERSVSSWATAMSAGPANEASQTHAFLVTNDNHALFSAQPAVAASGDLTYTSVNGAEGTATVSVELQDDGGEANGGVDTSPVQSFTIRLVTSATPTVVTNVADSGSGSLREMVSIAAVKTGADVVTFLPELSGQVITLASEITAADMAGVTIDATALPGGLTISGSYKGRVFLNTGSLELIGLRITGGNSIGGLANGKGGAIYNIGTCVMTGCTLSESFAHTEGGAIYNDNGKLELKQCTLSGNIGGSFGGAICNRSASDLILTQCTLSGNSTHTYGGAIFHDSGTAKLTHCTLAGNDARILGGAITNRESLLLHNCIVAANFASSGADIFSGTAFLSPSGINVIGDNHTISTAFPAGLPNAQGNYVGANPQLAPLGNYGGPTQTMALLPNSVARNRAGAVSPAITSDQRGFPIVGTPDVGAYESGTTNTFPVWSFETLGSAPSFANDNDRDGHADGLEYATRTNPAAPGTSPLITPIRNAAGGMEIRFPYRPGATDVRYVVVRSPDLVTWTEIYRYDTRTGVIEELGVTAEENAATQIITITDPVDAEQSFWRLRTELVP